ncbi:MAG: hypothetical protein LBC80_03240 [Treponema sp.]|jgi:hypothetical protein|nr:hypothetical protein [Treponema sp.]
MKKLTVFLVIGFLLIGSIFAQDRSNQRSNRSPENNSVTINGTLKLERGIVAVQSTGEGNVSVYFIPRLNRFIGFINGLREGESISVEGFRYRNVIQPTKVTIGGQSYDFTSPNFAHMQNRENPGNNRNQFRQGPGNNPNPGRRQNMGNRSNRNNHHNRNQHHNRGHNSNRRSQQHCCCCR